MLFAIINSLLLLFESSLPIITCLLRLYFTVYQLHSHSSLSKQKEYQVCVLRSFSFLLSEYLMLLLHLYPMMKMLGNININKLTVTYVRAVISFSFFKKTFTKTISLMDRFLDTIFPSLFLATSG